MILAWLCVPSPDHFDTARLRFVPGIFSQQMDFFEITALNLFKKYNGHVLNPFYSQSVRDSGVLPLGLLTARFPWQPIGKGL